MCEAATTQDRRLKDMLLPDHSLRLRRCGRLAAFDDGQLGAADAEDAADFDFDLGGEVGVLFDEQFGVLTALAEADVAVGEPGTGLLDDLVLDADVEELAGLGDAFAVADVELRLPEGCGHLVLDDLHLDARADHFLAFFDLVRAADVQAHGRIELESPAAGGGLRVAEHDTNFFTNLVDENHARFRLRKDSC